MSRLGDCYLAAVKTAEKLAPGAEVVHGTVVGEGAPRHGHAWVELDGGLWCVDRSNGCNVTLPQQVYYRLGRVEDARRYSLREARAFMLLQGHYGPWHPVDGDGLELAHAARTRASRTRVAREGA